MSDDDTTTKAFMIFTTDYSVLSEPGVQSVFLGMHLLQLSDGYGFGLALAESTLIDLGRSLGLEPCFLSAVRCDTTVSL
jgi:hypothetical protein